MSMILNILSPPGSNLNPKQKIAFDEIRSIIDSGTNDLLMGPDWASNISCCDRIRTTSDQAIINELIIYVRRKLGAKKPMTVFLTLSLVEAMVKNCGERIYVAINDEGFMKDFAKVVKKYSVLGKKGGESREVAELSADIMQAWGEAFLPRSKQYPNISRTYHELRKEGVPFKAQYDESRCPVFSPGVVQDNIDYVDSDLAAALQASIGFNDHQSVNAAHGNTTFSTPQRNHQSRRRGASLHEEQTNQPTVNSSELVTAVLTTSGMLREIIGASTSKKSFFEDEMMHEVVQQLHSLVGQLEQVILMEVEMGNEGVEGLFLANEEGTKVLAIFNDVKSGVLSYKNAKDQVLDSKPPSASSSSSKSNDKKTSSATTVDLLTSTRDDFLGRAVPFSSPSAVSTTTTAPPPPSSSSSTAQASNNFNAFDNWMAFDPNDNNNSSSATATAMSSPSRKATETTATSSSSNYHRSASMSAAPSATASATGPTVVHEDTLPPFQRSSSISSGSVLKPAIQSYGHKPAALLPPPQAGPGNAATRTRRSSSQASDIFPVTATAAPASASKTADFDPFSIGSTSASPAAASTSTMTSAQFDPFGTSGQSTDVNNIFGASAAAPVPSPVKPAIAETDILSLFSAPPPMAMAPAPGYGTTVFPGQAQALYPSMSGAYGGQGQPVGAYPGQMGAFPPAALPPQQQQQQAQQYQQYQTGLPYGSTQGPQAQAYPYPDNYAGQPQAFPFQQQQQQQQQYPPTAGMYNSYGQSPSQPAASAQQVPLTSNAGSSSSNSNRPPAQSDNPFDFF